MTVESYSYINSLDPSQPSTYDKLSEADDHIRGLKLTLKNQFPNLGNSVVTATAAQLSNPIPTGVIVAWYGSLAAIPAGWILCDGRTGSSVAGATVTTPDLRNRFILGATDPAQASGNPGPSTTGGAQSLTVTTSSAGAHTHGASTGGTALTVDQLPPHQHSYTAARVTATAGSGTATGSSTTVAESTTLTTSIGASATHTHAISSDGAHTHTATIDNRPSFLALFYLMKL